LNFRPFFNLFRTLNLMFQFVPTLNFDLMKLVLKLIYLVFCFSVSCIFWSGCKTFQDDSFDTFVGVVVDENGKPIPDLDLGFTDIYPINLEGVFTFDKLIYQIKTNQAGEFKFVMPTKMTGDGYFIVIPDSYVFELTIFGNVYSQNYVEARPSDRDKRSIINIGNIKVLRK